MGMQSGWAWDSTLCTGTRNPSSSAPYCYSGSKMGEIVTVKVNSFDNINSAGSVLVLGWLEEIKCERGFSKSQQMISVTRLQECLPSHVKPQGMKYCSDQDKVILDAHVGLFSIEMVLTPIACPSSL